MQRAAVLIGVNRTGALPVLGQAVVGAEKMAEWALDQPGFEESRVKVITDAHGPVHLQSICDAVQEIVDLSTVEQLIVYFAGHGVNKGRSEYWLLSQAPRNTNAAVNVAGSIELARTVGIPHVVFISDACRTAAEGINAQSITGGQIFPADTGTERCVDVFYASSLGSPALEIPDGQVSTAAYRAVFTETLLEGLKGEHDDLIQETVEAQRTIGLVRPRKLSKYLQVEVPLRLRGVKLPSGQPANQVPSALITSDDSAWLSRLRIDAVRSRRPHPSQARPDGDPETLQEVATRAVQTALVGGGAEAVLRGAAAKGTEGADQLGQTVMNGSAAFGPMHFESNCGFKVRGARIVAVYGDERLRLELLDETMVRVNAPSNPSASVLLEFSNGTGLVVPALFGFLCGLTFVEGELTSVGYEPSDFSPLWQSYAGELSESRLLRSLVSTAARLGSLDVGRADVQRMSERLGHLAKHDPAMAIYAAYALLDVGRRDLATEMHRSLIKVLNLRLFDLALIARELDGRSIEGRADLLPILPLCAQGWGLLRPYGVSLPESLAVLGSHLVPSIWSVFDASGVSILRMAIEAGELG